MGNQRENFSCQIIHSVYFNGSINNFQPDLIFSLTAFLMGDFRQKKAINFLTLASLS